MVRVDADAEGFAGNKLAAIDDGIKSHARDKDERGVNLFTLAVNAAEKRLDRSWSPAGKRRQRNLIQLLVCCDQGIGGSFVVEAKGSISRGNQRSVDGTHEGINTFVADLKIFIERPERFVERSGIEITAVFALESDGAAEERRVQEAGDALGVMVGEGIEADLAPGFSVERRDVVEGQRVALRLFAAIHIKQQNRAAVPPSGGVLLARR